MKAAIYLAVIFLLPHCIFSKYEIILDLIETILGENDQIYDFSKLRVKKFNRSTYVVAGIYNQLQDVGDEINVSIKAFNEAGGQYKMMFEKNLGPACLVYNEDHMKDTMTEFWAHSDNTEWEFGQCPMRKGIFTFKDYTPTGLGDYLPPYLPGGEKWKLSLIYKKGDELLGGLNCYARLRSNYSLMRYGG